jgi:hypothetical protein
LSGALGELGFSQTDIERMVAATGPRCEQAYGFTFSDLTQRLLPAVVLDAYPSSAVRPERALEVLANMIPTPPFREDNAS